MAIESRGDLASRHGSIGRIAVVHSWSYRPDNPIGTRTLWRDVLQLSKISKRATGWVDQAPPSAAG